MLAKEEYAAIKDRVLNIIAGDGDIGLKMNSQEGATMTDADVIVDTWSKELMGMDLKQADKELNSRIRKMQ